MGGTCRHDGDFLTRYTLHGPAAIVRGLFIMETLLGTPYMYQL